MALSDSRILAARNAGDVVIEPFRRDWLNTASYDVSLGEWYYREQAPELAGDVFNIYDPQQVAAVWGAPQRARTVAETLDPNLHLRNLAPDDQVILLGPGETILAHTAEYIGGRHHITTMMKARSSLGRSFILVCKCAGLGDVGYINRWTMEVTNVSQHYSIPLVVGERLAQIVFYETGPVECLEYGETGNYQTGDDLQQLQASWTPTMMLPRTKRSTSAPSSP